MDAPKDLEARREAGRGLVVLARHGRTAGNASRVIQVAETPLDEVGSQQAGRLAERLANEPFAIERILSSDLARAAMTAEAIQRRLGVPLDFDSVLHERSLGDLRGTPYAELDFDPFAEGYEPPGGESWPVFRERVTRAWETVEQQSAECRGGALVVVSHGLLLGELLARELDQGARLDEAGGFANTAVTFLRRGADDSAAAWRVERFACADHLGEPGER